MPVMGYIDINLPGYSVTPLFLLLLIGGVIGIVTFFFLTKVKQFQTVVMLEVENVTRSFDLQSIALMDQKKHQTGRLIVLKDITLQF